MAAQLVPKNPEEVMVIRDVTPNIVTCSVPFLRFGRIPIGGRGTIVKLKSGALAVFSPVALTPAVKAKLEGLGNNLKYIIALDFEHHIFIGDWHAAFPSATVIGPEGLYEKRQKDPEMSDVPIAIEFTKDNKNVLKITEEFDEDFEYEYLEMHPNKELAFFYKPEKTLIEADLLFNLPAAEQYSLSTEDPNAGFLNRLFSSFQSTAGEAKGQKRLLWYLMSRSDRTGFNKSVHKLAAWDFNRIIPCHGDVLEADGKEVFAKVFQWHLDGNS